MPDMPAPVANQIQPPSAQQGLSQLSSLLDYQRSRTALAQQQQTLQTGQFLQQEAAAKAQQEQLAAQQQQGIQAFFKTWDPSEHIGSDGTTDLDSALQSDEFKNAGNAKPAIMQSLLDLKNKQLTNKQSLTTLNKDLLTQFDTQVGALAKDDDVVADKKDPKTGVNAGRAKVQAFIDNFKTLSPDAARVANIYSPLVQHTPNGKLSNSLQALQMAAQSATEQQAQQNPTTVAQDLGGSTAFGTVPKATGIPTFNGPNVAHTLPPQVITQPGTGAPAQIGGAAGTTPRPIGGPQSPAAANWWQPGPGQTQMLAANSAALAGRLQAGNQAANQSPQALDSLSRARAILDRGKWTGTTFGLFKELQNSLAGVGIDTSKATDTNELVKNLARYEATRASGVGNTDAARSLFETGAPNTKVDAQAAKNIVTQSMANEMALQGYTKAVGTASDPQVATAREQQFRSIPNLVEAYEYGLMRSPQEADQFLNRYGLTKQQIAQARAELRKLGAL